jgi:hypothetical protein
MGIIITNLDPEYKLPFSHALNLEGVGFNSRTFLVGVGFSLWLYARIVRNERAKAQHRVGHGCVLNPPEGWAWKHPWPIVGLDVDVPLPTLALGADMPWLNVKLGRTCPWPSIGRGVDAFLALRGTRHMHIMVQPRVGHKNKHSSILGCDSVRWPFKWC